MIITFLFVFLATLFTLLLYYLANIFCLFEKSKIFDEDELMINELKNSMQSRSELRTKHMTQLEESKANLNEIKSKAAINLLQSNSIDQEFPTNDDEQQSSSKKERKSAGRVKTSDSTRSGKKSRCLFRAIFLFSILFKFI